MKAKDDDEDNDSAEAVCHRSGDESIGVVQERLSVEIERTETGSVRVRKVNYDEIQEIPVALRTESVEVQRVQINRPVAEEYGPRQEGATLIVPVFEYVPVTEWKLMLKEEVRITKSTSKVNAVHRASVQKQALIVERRDGESGDWVEENG
jgi:stress response protein YsnF